MATYTGTRAIAGVMPVSHHGGAVAVLSTFSLTAALASGDIINMLSIPRFAVVLDMMLGTGVALDTNATSTIAYDVGDATTDNLYFDNLTQGANLPLPLTHMTKALAIGTQYTVDTNIKITLEASPATGATAGTIYLCAIYSMDAVTATAEGTELP
jgi:hypothetical protein